MATKAGLIAGVKQLGTDFSSGLTFSTRFDGSHHDGAAAIRMFAYVPGCGCFHYTSGVSPAA